jgi:hypothetical protein
VIRAVGDRWTRHEVVGLVSCYQQKVVRTFLLYPRKSGETVIVFVVLGKGACLQGSTEPVIDLGKKRLRCPFYLPQMIRQVRIFVRHFVLLRRRFDMQPRAVSRPEKEHRSDLDYWSRSINPRFFDIAEAKAMHRPIDFLTSYVERQLAWGKGIDRP